MAVLGRSRSGPPPLIKSWIRPCTPTEILQISDDKNSIYECEHNFGDIAEVTCYVKIKDFFSKNIGVCKKLRNNNGVIIARDFMMS